MKPDKLQKLLNEDDAKFGIPLALIVLRCVAGVTKDVGWIFGFLIGVILGAALWVKA